MASNHNLRADFTLFKDGPRTVKVTNSRAVPTPAPVSAPIVVGDKTITVLYSGNMPLTTESMINIANEAARK